MAEDRLSVDALRAAVGGAAVVAGELWRRVVLEGKSHVDADARAADERLAKLETILADTERAEGERRRLAEAERDDARARALCPKLLKTMVADKAYAPHELARAARAPRFYVDLALRQLAMRGEIDSTAQGYVRIAPETLLDSSPRNQTERAPLSSLAS